MKLIPFASILLIGLVLFRSGSLVAQVAEKQRPQVLAYIDRYQALAMEEMRRTGIPASIKLAQGIHESGAGNSRLAREGNNHFGIKCKKEWTGPSLRHSDDRPKECFRKYDSAAESYRDHSDFLRTRSHYAFLFQLDPLDVRGWAYGLKRAGYATAPNYPESLLRLIDLYQLRQYDLAVRPNADPTVGATNKLP